ncbi:DUF5819 family protein [Leucobacter sp. PH1c]|uniref:DUF5819 family protein n=1 Tax=Leucobacter sp. PH1c TaxID=1397278 RepID=UPI00046976C6|nr:DUF5819 family protein [Leucobacter sp. PH1c]
MAHRKHTLAMRLGVLLTVVLTGWHIFASFLWISPPSELRTVVPGKALSNYMLPWYGQSWSVFAPAPINGDYFFKVRAHTPGPDGLVETEWVDATTAELSLAQYQLFPPRAAGLASQLASNFKGAYEELSDEQQEIAALGYYKGDAWLGRMQIALDEVGDDPDAVAAYISQERYASAYAAQVAQAVWGPEVVNVQFQVSRQNVIPFAERHNPDAERPAEQIVSTGWRGILALEDQSESAFAHTFRDALRRSGQ